MGGGIGIDAEGLAELRSIAAQLYLLAEDACLVAQSCTSDDEGDCEGDCGACPHFRCETLDRLRALGVDV